MKVQLAFGRDGAEVSLPEHIQALVLEAKFAQAVASADEALSDAFQHPIENARTRWCASEWDHHSDSDWPPSCREV